jgi:hypothetical protein
VAVKTSLDLDIDILAAAGSLARAQNISLGAAVSQLARRGLQVVQLPHFHVPAGARVITLDDVQRNEDEAG